MSPAETFTPKARHRTPLPLVAAVLGHSRDAIVGDQNAIRISFENDVELARPERIRLDARRRIVDVNVVADEAEAAIRATLLLISEVVKPMSTKLTGQVETTTQPPDASRCIPQLILGETLLFDSISTIGQ